ncbi:hypothetical protein GCM10011579_082810 [Streptomyces albiflavescens]|uniref:Luciferase-like domain-containing protein n=1 Tax=Streptomyces albiflavescens TaxID=1623582 RepID=A0A917YDA1_9ACTN|nr:LLM class flavin-dependent oxidoreductase [Streptomyces albiflavescens]GGN88773.1 hypothetical protein GCM10011579_082810 [Streptomyces albiflavescens]
MPETDATPARGRVGVMLPRDLPVRDVLPYARRAEELGFDQVWVVEDLGRRGGLAQAGPVLADTTSIKEYTTALRLLMRGEPGPADGRYVRSEGVVITEAPDIVPPGHPRRTRPHIAGSAGEVADGLLLAEPAAPACITSSLRHLGSASDAIGPEVVAAADDDEDAALARVRDGLTAIGEPGWAAHIDPLPFAAQLREHRAACADAERCAQTMPATWVRELSIAGTPDGAREAIRDRHAAGETSVVLAPTGPDALASLHSLASALDPHPRTEDH